MDPKERDRKLDAWLDEALGQYSDAEPRAGLEQRVLANVRAEERAPKRRWWVVWSPAFAAVAAIAIVAVAVRPMWREEPSPVAPTSPVAQQQPQQDQQVSRDMYAYSDQRQAELKAKTNASLAALREKEESRAATRTKKESSVVGALSDIQSDKIMNTPGLARAESAQAGAIPAGPPPPPPAVMSQRADLSVAKIAGERRSAESVELSKTEPAPIPLQIPARKPVEGYAISGVAPDAGVAAQSVGRGRTYSTMNAAAAPTKELKDVAKGDRSSTLSREEQLMLQAAAIGALQPTKEQMPPRDELLPMVKIPEIKIESLNDSEK